MSTPLGSGSWTVVQIPINVSQQTYDWNAPDQRRGFYLFRHQFTSWKKIHWITADKGDYLLSILGEGYAGMNHLMPTDPADKNDAEKFLDYLESTLDVEVSTHVRVYELEDIKQYTDESIGALSDCIHHLPHYA